MRHPIRPLFQVILLGAWLALGAGEARAQQARDEGTLFTGATVFPGFDGRRSEPLERRTSTAILVRGGRVVAIGDEGQLASTDAGREARRVDLTGAFVYPGFQDAHGQLERLGLDLEQVDLTRCTSPAALVQSLQGAASALPEGRWLRAYRWDSVRCGAATDAQRRALAVSLSEALPAHPVVLRDLAGDGILMNHAGWQRCGLAVVAPPTVGGDDGAQAPGGAGGWLQGAQAASALGQLPAPSSADRARRILRAQELLLSRGVTCVHVFDLDVEGARALYRLREDGRLRLRVVGYLVAGVEVPADEFRRWTGDPTGHDRFEVIGESLVLDGSLALRGAALQDAYADAPGERGQLRINMAAASGAVELAARRGLQPAIRCAGDRALGLALDVLERAKADVPGFIGLRPRLEGLDLCTDGAMARMRSLGLVASLQPPRVARQSEWVVARVGRDRALSLQSWSRLMVASPQPLALGSGFPASNSDPRLVFFAGVTRRPSAAAGTPAYLPSQALTANEVLGGMTSGAAFAATQEDRRGLLARGYGGDFTVLDMDLTQLSSGNGARALEAAVLMTVVNGEILHDAR